MAGYTFTEYTDMILIYGESGYDSFEAQRIYAQRFPDRQIPNPRTIVQAVQRMRDVGNCKITRENAGRTRNRRTVRMEEEVLTLFNDRPGASTREIAREMDCNHMSVWQVLNDEGLHPYHYTRVQQLNPRDFGPRVNFCEWYLQKCRDEPEFHRRVLFTDEATFTRQGFWNSRNSHVWDVENPNAMHLRGFQERFSVNVWAGIVDGHLIGPYFLPPRLTGRNYLNFLRETLPGLLEDVPLNIRRDMWIQHDGAPAHFSLNTRAYLNNIFEEKWIGRDGPVSWPHDLPI